MAAVGAGGGTEGGDEEQGAGADGMAHVVDLSTVPRVTGHNTYLGRSDLYIRRFGWDGGLCSKVELFGRLPV
jgi:hypothetical protein